MGLLTSLRSLTRRLPDDHRLPRFIAAACLGARTSGRPEIKVLVQCVADIYYLGLFNIVLDAMRKHRTVVAETFVLRSLDSAIGRGLRACVRRSYPHSGMLSAQWTRIYRQLLGAPVGYRSVSWSTPFADARYWFRAWRIWRTLGCSSDLAQLHLDGVLVGDLVADSYLRFSPAAEIKVRDPFLIYCLWQALRDLARANSYFLKARPDFYIGSYSTYIQHGVVARVALNKGVKVIVFGNFQQIGKRLSSGDPYHTKNPFNSFEVRGRYEDTDQALSVAHSQLEMRLSGGRDSATAYMTSSAYGAPVAGEMPDVSGATIVFLHDFFDSPHIYADMVFDDFWSWVCFTIDTLTAAGVPFLLKPHPNQVNGSKDVVDALKKRYPHACFLDVGVSNRLLAERGAVSGVTVYGTVAHELAYLGIPAICCARHPHVAFDFTFTARSIGEYRDLLARANQLRFEDPAAVRHQVLRFYVSHNLDGSPEELAARDLLVSLWRDCQAPDADGAVLAAGFSRLAAHPGFAQRLHQLMQLEAG